MRFGALVGGLLGSAIGCGLASAYACTVDAQCVHASVAGICQPTGFCSFPDETCASGQRYGKHASEDLRERCVDPDDGDETALSTATTTSGSDRTDATSSSSGVASSSEAATSAASTGEVLATTSGDESTTGEEPLDPDLIAWYRFEDLLDGVVEDSSTHGLHGTCEACPTPVAGVHGSAAYFEGEDQFVALPASPLFDLEALTVAAWARMETWPQGARSIVGRAVGEGSVNSWEIVTWVSSGRQAFVVARLAVEVDAPITLGYPVDAPSNEWHHGALTWDGELAKLYIDGEVVEETAIPTVVYDDHVVLIGADSDYGQITNHLHGTVDDLRIYRRALSAEEIAELAAPP